MARINNLTNFLNDVSSAIKTKIGDNTPIPAAEFDTKIAEIETGGNYQQKSITISSNGTQTVTPDTNYDAIEELTITTNVPVYALQTKSVEITTNGSISILPDTNYDGMSQVDLTVNVPQEGGSGDVKLFETIADMQADADPEDGDLAIVYRNETVIPSPGDTISSITPPATVIFDTAISGTKTLNLRGTNVYLQCRLTASQFRISDMRGVVYPNVTYTSSNGLTYTRTDSGAATYDLGENLTIPSTANTNILKFLQSGGMVFEGLYEYKSHPSTELIEGLTNVVSPSSYQTSTVEISDIRRVVELVENKLNTDVGLGSHPSRRYSIIKINNIYRVYFGIYIDSTYGNIESPVGLLFTDDKSYLTFGTSHTTTDILITDNLADTNGTTYKPYCYDVDITNETVTDTQLSTSSFTQITVGSNIKMKGPELTNLGVIVQYNVSNSGSIAYNVSYITSSGSSGTIQNLPTEVMDYLLADTQLTLSSSNQLLPDVVGYGKNGVITGDNSIYDNLNKLTLVNKVLSNSISSTHILASTYRNFNNDIQTRFFKKTNTMNSDILIDIPNMIYVDNSPGTIYPNSDGTKYYYITGSGTYSVNIYVYDTVTGETLLHIENVYSGQYARFGDYLYYIDAANGLKKLNINTLTSTLVYDFNNGGTVPSSQYALKCSLFKVDNDTLFFGACYNMNNTTTSKVYACVIKPSTDTIKPYINTTIVVRETTASAYITAYVTSTNIYCEVFYTPSGSSNRVRLYSYNRNTDTFVGQLFDIQNNPASVTTSSHWALPYANGFIASYDSYSLFAYYDLTNKTVTQITNPYAADGTTTISYPSRLHLLYNGDIMYDHSAGVWSKVLGITYDNNKYIITESEPFRLSATFYHNEQLVSVNFQTEDLIIDYENHTAKGPIYGSSFLSLQNVYGFGITNNSVTVDDYDFCIIEGAPYIYGNPYKLITGDVVGVLDIQNAEVENGILKEVEENA